MLFNSSFSTWTGEQPALGKQSSCLAGCFQMFTEQMKWRKTKQKYLPAYIQYICLPHFSITVFWNTTVVNQRRFIEWFLHEGHWVGCWGVKRHEVRTSHPGPWVQLKRLGCDKEVNSWGRECLSQTVDNVVREEWPLSQWCRTELLWWACWGNSENRKAQVSLCWCH